MNYLASLSDSARLQTLDALKIMDTPNEAEFDELAQLAAVVCGTPMSLMTLLDGRRQWFKANIGLAESETPVEVSFCAHAVLNPNALFIVSDASKDDRFAENPLVTGGPRIRFYAGMPVQMPDGHSMGTLCVIDTVPRQLTEVQEMALQVLARQVKVRLELRLQREALQSALRKTAEVMAQLRSSEELFRAFMHASPFLTFIKDENLRYVFYNKKFAEQFEISSDWLIGKHDHEFFPSRMVEIIRDTDAHAMRSNQLYEFEESAPGLNGTVEFWRSFKFRCFDAEGRAMLAGIAQNITQDRERENALQLYQQQLEAANQMLNQLAVTDALTGLSNRRSFDERLEIDFSMAVRRRRPLSVVMLDVDNFKQRNDRYGHAAGDLVLKQLAAVLNETVRLTDHAARYGGEEFAVILPETDTRAALLWTDRLHAALQVCPWQIDPVTASIGVATLNGSIETAHQLVVLADEALYAAKRGGKNRTVAYGGMESLAQEDLLGIA